MLFWKIDRKSDTMVFRSEDGYVQKDEAKKTGSTDECVSMEIIRPTS